MKQETCHFISYFMYISLRTVGFWKKELSTGLFLVCKLFSLRHLFVKFKKQ